MTARHKYALVLVACTFLLLLAGANVTSTKSSMAVPDWPLSFGQWMPEMKGGVAYEHGHRMIGALVGAIILGLAIWSWLREASRAVRWIAWIALIGVLVQGGLGGITVLWGTAQQFNDTHPVYSSVHGILGQIVFCLVLAYAQVTSRGWARVSLERVRLQAGSTLPVWGWMLLAVVFVQICLGAVMRQHNAGLIIPDFPLSQGRWIPEFSHWLVGVSYGHRLGAVVVSLVGLVLAAKVFAEHRGFGWLTRPALGLLVLIGVQVTLGAYTVWSGLNAGIATAHHAVGSLVLAVAFILALRLARLAGTLDFESAERVKA